MGGLPGPLSCPQPVGDQLSRGAPEGQLWLVFPVAPDGFEDEQPLVPLGDGSFRAGVEETSPERVRFDVVVDGKALRAVLSDGFYERDFTP